MENRREKTIAISVGPAQEGQRLDRLLAGDPAVGSRAAAQKLISSGLVTAGGRTRSKNYRVHAGEDIEVRVPPPEAQELEPEAMELVIPYEDAHLLVVDKPAGLVTHPARGHYRGTLVHGLLGHQIAGGEHPHRPGIVHRLDKDTSGLLIVAKDEETHRRLVRAMAAREIRRTYLALVHGLFATREGTIEAPLGRDARERQRMAVAGRRGREAVTHFRVIESWADGAGAAGRKRTRAEAEGFSLLEVRLETGRTHQIRVHLAAIGHPVAGDSVYGRRRDVLGVGRQFLHSARLEFDHPVTGEHIGLESPPPVDLDRVLAGLRERR